MMQEKFGLGLNDNPRPNRKIEKPEKQNGISRRDFIKAGVATGGVVALGIGGKLAIEGLSSNDQEQESDQQQTGPTVEQAKISDQDREVAGDTIENQLERGKEIILDRETKKAIHDKWLESYSPGGENHPGLETALERMMPWREMMKREFREQGVPEDFAYLTIPESHFDLKARSRKAAAGPYQFIESSAKSYGLRKYDGYDERNDPVLSARACAKHLKESYERFNNDWDLALADYNGAFTNEYAKFRKNKSERSYDDYLAWREMRLKEFANKSQYEHQIEKGDKNLHNIAKKYGLSAEQLMEFNNLSSDLIIIGKTLKLPPAVSVKMRLLRDSLENLNYPEKFYAVLKVIKQEKLPEKIAAKELKFETYEVKEGTKLEFKEKIGKGEGLFAVARKIRSRAKKTDPKFNVSVLKIQGMIQKQNGISNPNKVHPGQEITVSLEVGEVPNLKQLAKEFKQNLDLLKEFNPAVTRSGANLPQGIKIRIPKKGL